MRWSVKQGCALAVVLTAALGGAGCGTTSIVATDPGARIFVDNQMIGRGHGEITQRGTPGSATVVVKTDDGRHEQTVIRRKVTGLTLLGALLTYGTCLIFCWEYPDTVLVTLPPPGHSSYASTSWGMSGGQGAPPGVVNDPWLQPPQGWSAK
ncbi:MAG TPA: hypothetical protein VFH73_15625 [Polyangia bacterium]|nr:hypothetical protein [Polyangia bacterium]